MSKAETTKDETAAKAAIEAYNKAQTSIEKAEKAKDAALEKLHGAFGNAWLELNGELVRVSKNKYGFYLRKYSERPEPAVVLG